jgi:hypothetical protein
VVYGNLCEAIIDYIVKRGKAMIPQNIIEVIQAISKADERGNPASIFSLISERLVWDYAAAILDDPEYHYLYGPTLLQGIGVAFPHLEDRTAICATVLHALKSTNDSLVYEAAYSIILSYAKVWEESLARKFYKIFEESYESTLDGGDQFIARLALEGTVMLPIYRADDGLLHRAIGLLLDEFPPIPHDPGDPAYLSVKALKLLGRCYDRYPQDSSIAKMVQQTIGCANYAVDAEAHFILGVIKLYDAFRASDENAFLEDLHVANDLFKVAAKAEEGRTDAELFSTIIQCYLLLLERVQPLATVEMIRKANEVLTERLFSFGGIEAPAIIELESRLVQLISYLERWLNVLSEATQWPDLKPPLKILTEIYSAMRHFEVTEGLIGDVGKVTRELVMLPYIRGRFVQIQEVTAKLSGILSDQEWRTHASKSEQEFYELLLQEVKAVSFPKDLTATGLEKVRVAAEKVAPKVARLLSDIQENGEGLSEALVQIAWQLLDRESEAMDEIPMAEGPAKDIGDKLMRDLGEKLEWDTQSTKWKYLRVSIRLTAQYFVRMYRATHGEAAPEDVRFLFSEECAGLGKKAVEGDLESHFYKTMWMANWWGVIRRQELGAAPGKPDLLFRFHDDIVFPIEIKREFTHIDPSYIHDHYIAQAQSYGGGTQRISFLFVLDLTTKKVGVPLPNVIDCCYIDHCNAPNEIHQDYVIVWIFPANRLLPNVHSWSRKRKRSSS